MKKTKKPQEKKSKRAKSHNVSGVISITAKGTGYVEIPKDNPSRKIGIRDKADDIEIDYKHLNTALNGDTVEIILHPRKKGVRQTGEVVSIVSRAKLGFVGVLEKRGNIFFVKPDDPKMYTDILIRDQSLNKAKINYKVFAKIIAWDDYHKNPEGEITKVFGPAGDNNAEMHAIAMEKGFDEKLKEETENEALKIKKQGIQEKDYDGRRDFRNVLTFTIDPEDAKDFDDALSFKELEDGKYEIGIHIADVTHYVVAGSPIDKEARERGTSVYLVDRTIPMLPEVLSNDLCSLVPNQDRLTMSAVFTMNHNGDIESEWYGRTIIHSQKRFTYEEAEKNIKHAGTELHKELEILNKIAKKLNKKRFDNGAISLEQEEVKFVLNKDGIPLKVIKKIRGDSNKLIEEFMLLANRKVAEKLSRNEKSKEANNSIAIYRIHDVPTKEKTEDLVYFLKSLGHKVHLKNGIIPANEINRTLKDLAGKPEQDAVTRAIIRSQAKAIYSTENIGHFGLGFKYYTHFTSPIRRYPDMIIHRLLADNLAHKKIKMEELNSYDKISRISSEQEKRASDAERASIKYKQVEYMSKQIGKVFTGIISGINEWGIYVEEMDTKCEGMIRTRDMLNDYFIFNEKKLELIGKRTKKRYRFGDKVKVKVKSIDLERKTIDYVFV